VDCVNDSVILLSQARASGQRERDAVLLGLVGEGRPAVEDPSNLAGSLFKTRELAIAIRASAGLGKRAPAAGKLREVRAARHVLRRTGSW